MPEQVMKRLAEEIKLLEHELTTELPAEIKKAVALGDFARLAALAASAPNMGGFLMDHFLPRERAIALVAMCKACVARPARARLWGR